RTGRILHLGVLALVVAADEHRAAARVARSIDLCVANEAHLVAKHLDLAALRTRSARYAACIQYGRVARLEDDPAGRIFGDGVRAYDAALVDQSCVDPRLAAFGKDLPDVERLASGLHFDLEV